MKKRQLLLNMKSSLRRCSLLCFLMFATLGTHAEPGKVSYYSNGDGTAGFMILDDFLYAKPVDGAGFTGGISLKKVVIQKTWDGLPVKTYGGGWVYPTKSNPYNPFYEKDYDYRNHGYEIDTLIVEAEIENIDYDFPSATVMYFPKSLKRITGNIYQWNEGRDHNNGNNATREVYFEEGSQLEILGSHDFITSDGAFCYLQEFKIPSTVKQIGDYCFAGQWVYNVCKYPLPPGLLYIGKYAFATTTGANVTVDHGPYDFEYEPASEILDIPASVQLIDICAFSQCTGIKTVIIEDGTNLTIERSAFDGDDGTGTVETVICKSTTPFKMYAEAAPEYYEAYEPEEMSGAFTYDDGNYQNFPELESGDKPRLYVPVGYKEIYEETWTIDENSGERKQYKDIFTIIEGVVWGTIVVPNNNQKAFEKGIARLAELKSCDVKDGDTWRLVFDEKPVTFETKLEQGKPYLCVPPKIEVTGTATVTPVEVSDNGYTITYTGNLSGERQFVPNGAYYFGSGTGKCYLNTQGNNAVGLKNGRCYFTVDAPSGAKPLTMDVVLNNLDGSQSEATVIEDLLVTSKKDADISNGAIYNLQGVQMNSEGSLPKGIYIQNGKKVIIK